MGDEFMVTRENDTMRGDNYRRRLVGLEKIQGLDYFTAGVCK